jgi:hypothetical protein
MSFRKILEQSSVRRMNGNIQAHFPNREDLRPACGTPRICCLLPIAVRIVLEITQQ